jgi:nucleoside-diphosphate-sugar epimerase
LQRSSANSKTLSIAVLGASGVYGRHLLPRLVARGHHVRALVRTPHSATQAAACGAEVRTADIFDKESLRAGLEGCDIALNLSTALRKTQAGTDYALNDRVRREGVPIFLRACKDAGVARVIQQSICMAHGAGEEWADEDTSAPVAPNPIAKAAIETVCFVEETVKRSGLDWVILSGGLFYGPGTVFDDDWFAGARAGTLRLPGDGMAYVSLIHIADMAEATAAAIDRWPSRRTLIVADDAPSRWRDVLGFVAASIGAAAPTPGGREAFPSWRVRNQRAKAELNWSPFYADYRAGLAR